MGWAGDVMASACATPPRPPTPRGCLVGGAAHARPPRMHAHTPVTAPSSQTQAPNASSSYRRAPTKLKLQMINRQGHEFPGFFLK